MSKQDLKRLFFVWSVSSEMQHLSTSTSMALKQSKDLMEKAKYPKSHPYENHNSLPNHINPYFFICFDVLPFVSISSYFLTTSLNMRCSHHDSHGRTLTNSSFEILVSSSKFMIPNLEFGSLWFAKGLIFVYNHERQHVIKSSPVFLLKK